MRPLVLLCAWAALHSVGCVSSKSAGSSKGYSFADETAGREHYQVHAFDWTEGQPRPLTTEERGQLGRVARKASTSVVQIQTAPSPTWILGEVVGHVRKVSARSRGTGVVVSERGVILTTRHVVEDATSIAVTLPDGTQRPVERVVCDRHLDLAVLLVEGGDLHALLLSDGLVRVGTPVVAVGSLGSSHTNSYAMGRVTNPIASLQGELDFARARPYGELIESTIRLESGSSGGPVIDSDGRFVGLNVAVVETVDGEHRHGYAIPFTDRSRHVVARLTSQLLMGEEHAASAWR